MICIVYLNGDYLVEVDVKVLIFDWGFIMVDGVYEVISVLDGKILEFKGYFVCFVWFLKELGIGNLLFDDEWLVIYCKLVELNKIDEGVIYLQVMCGNVGDCDFVYLFEDMLQIVVLFMQVKFGFVDNFVVKIGICVIFVLDLCWLCCDIKMV